MKREILFRAWTKEKKMQYNVVPFQWDYVIDTMWHKCIESNGNGILGSGGTEAKFEVGGFAINEGDIMQFTGLKDKNGKEIYEGDVLDGLFIVKWNFLHCCFGIFTKRGFMTNLELMPDEYDSNGERNQDLHSDTWEVIGNIYENPELCI